MKNTETQILSKETAPGISPDQAIKIPRAQFEKSLQTSLESYSNVHRGSGQASMVTTHLYEKAREIILDYFGFSQNKYTVVFCSPRRAEVLTSKLMENDYRKISSAETGLPLGIVAVAARKSALPGGIPFETGGGTTRLISKKWVLWSRPPDRFEAGTPPIINAIALAKALQLQKADKNIIWANFHENEDIDQVVNQNFFPELSGKELLEKLIAERVGKNLEVPTTNGNKPYINLDNAASTPTFSPIWEAYRQALFLPEKSHGEIIRRVKTVCHRFLNAPEEDYEIIFTTNATEAVNIAACGLRKDDSENIQPVVLGTLLEHSSNDLPWRYQAGVPVVRVDVDTEGFIDLHQLENMLIRYNQKKLHGNQRIRLMALCGASNVLGSYNDIEKISNLVHRHGVRLLVDAAQMAAHRKIDMKNHHIDYLALSGHKVYAPFGSSLLCVRKGSLNYTSGEIQTIKSSGDENVAGIAALGQAIGILQRTGLDAVEEKERALTATALLALSTIPRIRIFGIKNSDDPRFDHKGGVIPFGLKGVLPGKVAQGLAIQGGIGVRYGCHCAHILVKHMHGIPPLLEQFQRLIISLFPKLNLPGVVRISFGIYNTQQEIDNLICTLNKLANQSKPDWKTDRNSGDKMMAEFVKNSIERVFMD